MKLNIAIPSKQFLTTLSAIIMGYLLWTIIAQHQSITLYHDLPLCFYNTTEKIAAPEYVRCQLRGKRNDFCTFYHDLGAIHIDAHAYTPNESHLVSIKPEDIFLRNDMQLVNYTPLTIKIDVQQKEENT